MLGHFGDKSFQASAALIRVITKTCSNQICLWKENKYHTHTHTNWTWKTLNFSYFITIIFIAA